MLENVLLSEVPWFTFIARLFKSRLIVHNSKNIFLIFKTSHECWFSHLDMLDVVSLYGPLLLSWFQCARVEWEFKTILYLKYKMLRSNQMWIKQSEVPYYVCHLLERSWSLKFPGAKLLVQQFSCTGFNIVQRPLVFKYAYPWSFV